MTPEGLIKNNILDWLTIQPGCFVFPVDSVGIYDATKGRWRRKNSRHHIRGVSDILGIWQKQPLAIEVKSKTGRLTPEQKIFLENFKNHGGISIIARSQLDVIKVLDPTSILL